MIFNPAKREDRVIMLKAGFTEKELGGLFNHLKQNVVTEVDWNS